MCGCLTEYCEYHGEDRYRVFEKDSFTDTLTKSWKVMILDHIDGLSHLRTFRRELFLSIDDNDEDTDGEYYSMAGDFAFMFPMLEMAGVDLNIQDVMYVYNRTNILAEDKLIIYKQSKKVGKTEQTADRVRQSKRYSKLDCLLILLRR